MALVAKLNAQTETEVAVLQVQYKNLDEKVDEIKVELKDIRDDMARANESTQNLIKDFQSSNIDAHKTMAAKIAALEKWRWMMMGAGIALGALGYNTIGKILQ